MSKGLQPGETKEQVYARALNNSPRARDLVAAYQANIPKTPRDKAIAEAEIWEAICTEAPEDKKAIIRINGYNSTFLSHALGNETPNAFIARARTLGWERRGAHMATAWESLEHNQNSWLIKALSYANQEAEAFEDHLETKVGMDAASVAREVARKFEAAFKAYREDPTIQNEEKRRNREASALRKKSKDTPKKEEVAPPAPPKRTKGIDEILSDGDFQQSRDCWNEIETPLRAVTLPFIQTRLNGLDSETGVEELLNDFITDVRVSYQTLLTKIRRVRSLKGSKAIIEVKREKIRWALEVLRVQVQRAWRKEDLDTAAIKKQYRHLASRFHPDRPTSDDMTRARFSEVQEAYKVLQDSGLNI